MTRRARRIDLAFRPKRYWRQGQRSTTEAEVARIRISAFSDEAIVLTARRAANGRIAYRLRHIDAAGRAPHALRTKRLSTTGPLSLGELVELLETACYARPCLIEGDDERYGGVIWGTLRLHLEHAPHHADEYLDFLRVSSDHYPHLERYYARRLDEWCLAHCMEDEDCRKVVRMRTGRFPRKLIDLART